MVSSRAGRGGAAAHDQPTLLGRLRCQGWPEAIAQRREAPLTPEGVELIIKRGPPPHFPTPVDFS